ncbi:hypothetical protein GCM10010388_57330 [Streptomyces mauvecolor]
MSFCGVGPVAGASAWGALSVSVIVRFRSTGAVPKRGSGIASRGAVVNESTAPGLPTCNPSENRRSIGGYLRNPKIRHGGTPIFGVKNASRLDFARYGNRSARAEVRRQLSAVRTGTGAY